MSITAKLYCASVILAGSGILGYSMLGLESESPARFIVYVLCAALLATFKFRMPGLKATVSGGSLLIFASMSNLSINETVIVALATALSQCLWKSLHRPRLVQVAFSAGTLIASAALTQFLCVFAVSRFDLVNRTGVMLLGAAAFYLLNTSFIAAVLGVTELRPPMRVWKDLYLWTLPHYVFLALAGGVLSNALAGVNWVLIMAAMPFAYVMNQQRLEISSR